MMDYRVERLRTVAECGIFVKNAVALKRPDLAIEARRKAINLQTATHTTSSTFEMEAFASVYAYEALLEWQSGKKKRATGTWQAIRRYGIVEAIQRAVSRSPEAESQARLRELGLEDLGFDAFVLRHEDSFAPATVQLSKDRQTSAA